MRTEKFVLNGNYEINRTREKERGLTEVDFAEGSTSDLAAELVLAANDAFHVKKIQEAIESTIRESKWSLLVPSEEKPKPHSR